jgi:hypothetical protein
VTWNGPLAARHGPTYTRIEAEADLFADRLLAGQREAARSALAVLDPYAGDVGAKAGGRDSSR